MTSRQHLQEELWAVVADRVGLCQFEDFTVQTKDVLLKAIGD